MDKLGIEPTLLLAQIVNFAIVVAVLSKLLYKPILSMLEKRKKEIEEGMKMAAKAREDEVKLEEKKERMLATARKEAQEIMEEARKQAKAEEHDIIAAAHKDVEGLMVKAKEDIARMRDEMEKSVRDSAVELAVAMAKKLLTGVLSSADQHKLIAKQVKEIGSMKVS